MIHFSKILVVLIRCQLLRGATRRSLRRVCHIQGCNGSIGKLHKSCVHGKAIIAAKTAGCILPFPIPIECFDDILRIVSRSGST